MGLQKWLFTFLSWKYVNTHTHTRDTKQIKVCPGFLGINLIKGLKRTTAFLRLTTAKQNRIYRMENTKIYIQFWEIGSKVKDHWLLNHNVLIQPFLLSRSLFLSFLLLLSVLLILLLFV